MKRKQRRQPKKTTKSPKMDTEETVSPFESLLKNPGYFVIVNQICENLDAPDLFNCHRVSKSFNDFLNQNKKCLISQLHFIRKAPKKFSMDDGTQQYSLWGFPAHVKQVAIGHLFPKWTSLVYKYYETQAELEKLQKFTKFMKRYFFHEKGNILVSNCMMR